MTRHARVPRAPRRAPNAPWYRTLKGVVAIVVGGLLLLGGIENALNPTSTTPSATPTEIARAGSLSSLPTTSAPAASAPTTVAPPSTGEPNEEGTGATIPPVAVSPPPTGCVATDQDQYVYNPSRLQVVTACLQVAGTVAAIRTEADGDLHVLIALDPTYRHLLTPANQGEELGDLVVEPVCVDAVSQADAVATCAGDADPIGSVPSTVGAHIWLQGRYVLDLQHGGWAELHPLYRWGAFGTAPLPPGPTPRPTRTPAPGTSFAVRITSLTSPINRGAIASLHATTRAGADCTITVQYKSGPSKAAGLGPQTASAAGALVWSWKVGSNTTPGRWPVTVRCTVGSPSASATAYLTVH
jgi:hypothetical protein